MVYYHCWALLLKTLASAFQLTSITSWLLKMKFGFRWDLGLRQTHIVQHLCIEQTIRSKCANLPVWTPANIKILLLVDPLIEWTSKFFYKPITIFLGDQARARGPCLNIFTRCLESREAMPLGILDDVIDHTWSWPNMVNDITQDLPHCIYITSALEVCHLAMGVWQVNIDWHLIVFIDEDLHQGTLFQFFYYIFLYVCVCFFWSVLLFLHFLSSQAACLGKGMGRGFVYL